MAPSSRLIHFAVERLKDGLTLPRQVGGGGGGGGGVGGGGKGGMTPGYLQAFLLH